MLPGRHHTKICLKLRFLLISSLQTFEAYSHEFMIIDDTNLSSKSNSESVFLQNVAKVKLALISIIHFKIKLISLAVSGIIKIIK